MAISSDSVAVAATEVALNTAGTAALSLVVRNSGASPAALGPSGVTLAGGFQISSGQTVDIALDAGDVIFAIADVTPANTTLKVLRT